MSFLRPAPGFCKFLFSQQGINCNELVPDSLELILPKVPEIKPMFASFLSWAQSMYSIANDLTYQNNRMDFLHYKIRTITNNRNFAAK